VVVKFASRLIFPIEAINYAPFRALYEQIRHLGEERIDNALGEVTFFHPGTRGGRIDSLERLLVNGGLPFNLHCATAESVAIHYWRPGMPSIATTQSPITSALRHPKILLSARRASDEFVCAQAGFASSR
jgi:hypothetical protein